MVIKETPNRSQCCSYPKLRYDALIYIFYAYILHNILKSHKHCITSHDYGICIDKIPNKFENVYRNYKIPV